MKLKRKKRLFEKSFEGENAGYALFCLFCVFVALALMAAFEVELRWMLGLGFTFTGLLLGLPFAHCVRVVKDRKIVNEAEKSAALIYLNDAATDYQAVGGKENVNDGQRTEGAA